MKAFYIKTKPLSMGAREDLRKLWEHATENRYNGCRYFSIHEDSSFEGYFFPFAIEKALQIVSNDSALNCDKVLDCYLSNV